MSSPGLTMIVRVMGALLVCGALSACAATSPTNVEGKADREMSVKMQLLQKQIKDRDRRLEEQDKRIQELESQLDVLKLIDEDREKQRKPLQPPTTVEPSR